MADQIKGLLARQYDTAWTLARFHLEGLTEAEWAWRPTSVGLHVEGSVRDGWRGVWPERETYDVGPPSIAWVTWHIGFWWSTVLDRSFGEGRLTRQDIIVPGPFVELRPWLGALEQRWRSHIQALGDDQLLSSHLTRWPFTDRPFGDVVAWATMELTKNAAEIGYVRFLWAQTPLRRA